MKDLLVLEGRRPLAGAADPEAAWTGEWRLRRADATLVDVDLTAHLLALEGSTALLVFADDITHRKRAQDALRRSEEQYRSVVDNIRQVIFKTNARGVWTFLNAAWTDITGFSVDETLGKSFLHYVHPEDRRRHAEIFQPLLENRAEYFGHVARYLTKAGNFRWIEVFAQLTLDGDGRVQGMFGTLTDITERKCAEEELLRTRARLEHLLVSSPAVIYSRAISGDHAITFVGENITRLLGYSLAEVLDAPAFWADHIHPQDAPGVLGGVRRLVRGAPDARGSQQYRVRHRDGSWRWIHDEQRVVRDGADRPVEIVGSWVDVTEHRRSEDERARLSSVVEQSVEAIVITGLDGTIEYVNPAYERLTGYSRAELVGRTPALLKSGAHGEEFYREMWAVLASGAPWAGRFINRRQDGSRFEAEAVISPVRDTAGRLVSYVGGMRDVTHERQVEEQLRQAQKMEVAGRLAGGVAHDFNNLLTVITGRSQILLKKLPADSPHHRDLQLMQDTAERAAALTRQLLVFSRKQMLAPQVLDVNGVVSGMERMLRRLIGEDIELIIAAAPGPVRVKADPSQLEQVVMNLVVNSRDAMPTGGRLTVEVAEVVLDEAFARCHVEVRPGPYVMLRVSDTGCGIDPATKAHLFEPFFTTKGPDRGTGLGLSTVYGIVKQSDGHILVDSAPGRGATFSIYLPRVDTTTESAHDRAANRQAPRGTETILVAEDEADVRDIVREVLRDQGYTVLEARHGAEALERGTSHAGPIHLLMTDIVMPQMGGRELAQRLRWVRPGLRVLYMSGYTEDAMLRHRVSVADCALIEKPFTPDGLARKVREVLQAPPGALEAPGRELLLAHGGG